MADDSVVTRTATGLDGAEVTVVERYPTPADARRVYALLASLPVDHPKRTRAFDPVPPAGRGLVRPSVQAARVLDVLTLDRERERAAVARQADLVADARRLGVRWEHIGAIFGLTAEGARTRWGRRG